MNLLKTFTVVMSASITILVSEICDARAKNAVSKVPKSIILNKIDGPYTYKSPKDLIAIVGFVTERTSNDDALFRDCDGNINTVKRRYLKRTERNCPPGSSTTPWIINAAGKLVPLTGPTPSLEAHFSSGKTEIDPAGLPARYRADLTAAKRGTPAAVSYTASKGKLNLSIIRKPHYD